MLENKNNNSHFHNIDTVITSVSSFSLNYHQTGSETGKRAQRAHSYSGAAGKLNLES